MPACPNGTVGRGEDEGGGGQKGFGPLPLYPFAPEGGSFGEFILKILEKNSHIEPYKNLKTVQNVPSPWVDRGDVMIILGIL